MPKDRKLSKEYVYQKRIREIEEEIIDFLVKIGEHRYLTPKFSTIFGYLIIHRALSQSELNELTGYSIATVSNTLRLMLSLNLANKRLRPNSHEYEYYVFGENLGYKHFLTHQVDQGAVSNSSYFRGGTIIVRGGVEIRAKISGGSGTTFGKLHIKRLPESP